MGLWGEPAMFIKPSVPFMKQCKTGDINSFFMLFFDNFSSLIAILGGMISAPKIAMGFDFASSDGNGVPFPAYYDAFEAMIFQKVCPGIGMALLFGNLWYWWMAAKLAAKEDRMDVTALPYGINTPAGFLTVYMVMLPLCFDNNPAWGLWSGTPKAFADKIFHAACCANFIGGLFEVAGIVLGNIVRHNVPRAALFGPICGVGFVWLGFNPLIDCMREPFIGMLPLVLIFTSFFANKGRGIYHNMVPMACVIFLIGTALWWCGLARWDTHERELNDVDKMGDIVSAAADKYPGKIEWTPFVVLKGMSDVTARAVAIQFPIALASFLETIENVEAAHLIGDSYNVNEAMLADGLGTAFGAMCGAVMPTTVYIGHRRHKAAGATGTFSLINGIVYFILMFSGLMGLFFYLIDPVSIGVILIAVGLMIVQQSLETSVSRHYPALMIGIMFVVADMVYFDHFDAGVGLVTRTTGRTHGVANMAPAGGIMCSLMVPAILCDLTDCRFLRAAIFSFIASMMSLFGLMHGNNNVFYEGTAFQASDYTTDLGEAMISTEKYPTQNAQGVPIPDTGFKYMVDDKTAFGTPPTFRAVNEGWRFSVAYACVMVFCLLHYAYQKAKPGKMDPIMDNGKVEDEVKDGEAPPPGKTEVATA